MHISSNEASSQNQLAIGGVTHKLYIHAQTLEFYQCGTNPHFYNSNMPNHVCTINKALDMQTIFNQTRMMAN